ncbi:MAG: hypothetical protein HQK84_01700 [Nitrospinae bacterium]|nr:hypothetical protein [Nitrospinota bacterium]
MELENILKIEYIFAFATLILPGFIIMKIVRLKVPNKDFLLKDVLFEAFSYSLLNIAITGWVPYLLIETKHENWAIFSLIFILTVSPVFLAFCYIKLISSKYFREHFDIQIPTAWDWYFSQKPNSLLRVHLKDGTDIIGYFGGDSYATSYPNEGSIYLEKVYTIDNDGLKLIENSNGVLIAKDQYTSIEFYITGESDG